MIGPKIQFDPQVPFLEMTAINEPAFLEGMEEVTYSKVCKCCSSRRHFTWLIIYIFYTVKFQHKVDTVCRY